MTKLYVICDGDKGGIHLLSPFHPDIIGPPNGMLEPDGTFVGVVYANSPTARQELADFEGITVLPSHVSRGKQTQKHKSKLAKIGSGAHGIQATDDGYSVAEKLHGYYKGITAEGSRCCAVLHPDA